ncbi:MAG: aminomethyl transferase family protein, partial [Mesorhizobium sp.]
MIQVGGRAYLTNSLESGWLPRPLPAFYSGKSTAGFRKWLSADEIDANVSLGGSFFSENIEDYYFSPYDVGYGKIVKFDHDFIGRKALEAQVADGQTTANRKVTLQWNGDDVAKAWASMYQPGVGAKFINLPIAHYATYHYDRVEAPNGSLAGRSLHT